MGGVVVVVMMIMMMMMVIRLYDITDDIDIDDYYDVGGDYGGGDNNVTDNGDFDGQYDIGDSIDDDDDMNDIDDYNVGNVYGGGVGSGDDYVNPLTYTNNYDDVADDYGGDDYVNRLTPPPAGKPDAGQRRAHQDH